MRSNAVLVAIRFFALLLILLGTAYFVGLIFVLLNIEAMQGALANQGGEALLGWLMIVGPIFQTPLLVVAAGTMLFVLVGIALRMEKPRDQET